MSPNFKVSFIGGCTVRISVKAADAVPDTAARACLLIVGLCSSMIEVCHNGLDLRSSRMHSGSELNHFCQRMRAVKAARLVIAAAL